jgi:hypothetical protein
MGGLAALTALVGVMLQAAPAQAQTTYYSFQSEAGNLCIVEYASTSAVYLQACSSNHSDIWFAPSYDFEELANAHSGLCLAVSGRAENDINAQTCRNGDTAEEWVQDGYGGIENLYSKLYLWQSNGSVQQRPENVFNVHDLWYKEMDFL